MKLNADCNISNDTALIKSKISILKILNILAKTLSENEKKFTQNIDHNTHKKSSNYFFTMEDSKYLIQ